MSCRRRIHVLEPLAFLLSPGLGQATTWRLFSPAHEGVQHHPIPTTCLSHSCFLFYSSWWCSPPSHPTSNHLIAKYANLAIRALSSTDEPCHDDGDHGDARTMPGRCCCIAVKAPLPAPAAAMTPATAVSLAAAAAAAPRVSPPKSVCAPPEIIAEFPNHKHNQPSFCPSYPPNCHSQPSRTDYL